ncbi:MAG: TonB family protein [Acidobacteria bacterium]|nr:TonB family protein [Acidobacteriota bacterium]
MLIWNSIRKQSFALGAVGVLLSGTLSGQPGGETQGPSEPAVIDSAEAAPQGAGRLTEQRTGTFAVGPGMRFRLLTDIGSIKIHTAPKDLPSSQMRYVVRIESDRTQPEAAKLVKQFSVSARTTPDGVSITGVAPWKQFRGRVWVYFDVSLPRGAQVDVQTHAGNIETEDVDGRAVLLTSGGNIFAGNLGGTKAAGARLETAGGHITVGDVRGGLVAITGGGHIAAGTVTGDATMRTSGGHVRVESIAGVAALETGGGNIVVLRANSRVTATTAGGRIEFGEITGGIRAKTGGGGIRVNQVIGPTDVSATSGSIYLTKVKNSVNASTESGGITAWFATEGQKQASSQLVCGQGDITVYLPRNLSVTIDAAIEMAAEHRIEAEPALGMRMNPTVSATGARSVRGDATVNGGGQILKLRTIAGNIRLRYMDGAGLSDGGDVTPPPPPPPPPGQNSIAAILTSLWSSRVAVGSDEMKSLLRHSVRPAYSQSAKSNRLQGMVRLEVQIGKEGNVEDVKIVYGPPILSQAAMEAVKQWRYKPYVLNGNAVPVVTAVYIDFRLE